MSTTSCLLKIPLYQVSRQVNEGLAVVLPFFNCALHVAGYMCGKS